MRPPLAHLPRSFTNPHSVCLPVEAHVGAATSVKRHFSQGSLSIYVYMYIYLSMFTCISATVCHCRCVAGGIGASLSAVINESLFNDLDHEVI
jgi:hypothetical protein